MDLESGAGKWRYLPAAFSVLPVLLLELLSEDDDDEAEEELDDSLDLLSLELDDSLEDEDVPVLERP
jgi:hypothetical protein